VFALVFGLSKECYEHVLKLIGDLFRVKFQKKKNSARSKKILCLGEFIEENFVFNIQKVN
jgi:hypothetical protein